MARGWEWGGRRWMTDAPEAETHLLQAIKRLTQVNAVEELPVSADVFPVLYDLIVGRPQIPGIYGAMSDRTWEQDGFTPHWRGIHDEDGRLTVAIGFNMDLGDASEHADAPEYPQRLLALAYQYAINFPIYPMSH
jgi:hypothetical protein